MVLDGYSSAGRGLSALVPLAELPLLLGRWLGYAAVAHGAGCVVNFAYR